MNRQEIIERLKNNKEAFGLMDKELQEAMKGITRPTCIFFNGAEWEKTEINHNRFCSDIVYRIPADYQDEPEIVKCEVKTNAGWLEFKYNNNIFALCHAVNLPEFSHFEYEDATATNPRLYSCATKPALIPKYVVFVKENN